MAIDEYLKISELNEAHRVSSIAWDKFARNIRIELAKHPDERIDAKIFIKVCRQEFDRLMETSPDIRESVILEFNKKFVGREGSKKRKRFEQLRKPDICDTIISVNEIRHKWYKELENTIDDYQDNAIENQDLLIKEQKDLLQEKEVEIRAFTENSKTMLKRQLDNMKTSKEENEKLGNFKNEQMKLINTYIDSFKELYERRPLRDEILSNIENNIDQFVLNEFLEKYDEENIV